MISRAQIPETINSAKLLKELSKEIRHAERYLIQLNPPKPERESKRKKKKPINKDFVGFDVASRMPDNPFKATLKDQPTQERVLQTTADLRPPLKMTLPKSSSVTTLSRASALPEEMLGEKSKPGKQSPTVIRFKLGDNEVVRSTGANVNVYGNFAIDPTVETPKELTWKQTSVYDFHDGSNESDYGGFTIDEAPKKKRSSKGPVQKKQKCFYDNSLELLNDAPKNGIEELLKASAYALGGQRLNIKYVIINCKNKIHFEMTFNLNEKICFQSFCASATFFTTTCTYRVRF